jgi:predicted TIM-barrel fold metal-dependent hydrolase
MKVVDAHVHLWDTQQVSYPWLEKPAIAYSGDNRLLPKRYDVQALMRDAGDVEVEMTVNVEANPADALAEARWLQALADDPDQRGHPHGIVAYVDLSQPSAPRQLDALAACRNLRGIRQILNVHPDPRYSYVDRHYMAESLWRENLRRLAAHCWSYDLQIYPAQVPLALEVIDANPDITFIVNHTGMFVDRDSVAGWHAWKRGLGALAARPNTAIKLSGLAMFDHLWTIESFRPLVLEAIDAFGAKRCMFASNFPIDRLHATYGALWSAFARIVAGGSAAERDDLLRANAKRYYRLAAEGHPAAACKQEISA